MPRLRVIRLGLLLAALGGAGLGASSLDSGGVVIPATFVYDVVEKNGDWYVTAESTSGKGILFQLENDTVLTPLAEFSRACLSLGFVNDTFFLGLAGNGLVLKSTSSGASWDATFPVDGASDIWKVFRTDSGVLWIGTGNNGDIFRPNYAITTGGSQMTGPTTIYNVRAHNGDLWACTDFDAFELWKSTNNGASWSMYNHAFPGSLAYDIYWDNDTLYVGLNSGKTVQRSTNSGATWDTTLTPNGISDVYWLGRPQGRRMWAGTGGNGDVFEANYKYTLGGSLITGPSFVYNMDAHSGTLYACTDFSTYEVWASTNNGASWQPKNWNLPGTVAYDLFWDSNVLYAATNGGHGPMRSFNDGASWDSTLVPDGVSEVYVVAKPTDQPLWLGTGGNGDVFRANYEYTLGGSQIPGPTAVNDVEEDGSILWAGATSSGNQVWKSTNGGASWQTLPTAPWSNTYDLLAMDGWLYAATDNQGNVYVSYDGASHWFLTGDLSGASTVYCLQKGQGARTNRLLAGTGSLGDVYLSDPIPPPGIFSLLELNPNPNPTSYQVMQGGTFHRYYRVVDTVGVGKPWVGVTAVCEQDTYYLWSGADGIIDIAIPTAGRDTGTTLSCKIVSVGRRNIPAIKYTADVLPRRYGRDLTFDGKLKVGADVFGPGLKVMLYGTRTLSLEGTASDPDSLRLAMRAARGACGQLGGSVGVLLEVDEVKLGALATAECYAGGAIFEEGKYRYAYPVPSSGDLDKAALFLMFSPDAMVPASQILVPIAQFLGNYVNSPLLNSVEKGVSGVDVFAGAEGRAAVGLATSPLPIGPIAGFGAEASRGAKMHAGLGMVRLPPDGTGVEGDFYGEISQGASADYILAPTPDISAVIKDVPAQIGVYRWSGQAQFLFSGVLDCGFGSYATDEDPSAFMLYLTKRTSAGTETDEFWIHATDAEVMRDFVSGIERDLLAGTACQMVLRNGVPAYRARPETFARSFYAVLQRAVDFAASGRWLNLTHCRYNTDSDELLGITFKLGAGLGTDVKIGADVRVANDKRLLTEQSEMLQGKSYKLYTYVDDSYTQTQDDVTGVPFQLAGQVLTGIIDDILEDVVGIMPGNYADSLVLGVKTCTLTVRSGARPAGDSIAVVSWTWQSESTDDCAAARMRRHLQDQAGLEYGIGGFYQVQRETAHVNYKAKLKIAYADSELVGINEADLRMFRWSDSLRKWQYIGGVLHPDSNYVVKDSLQLLGLYTLAPIAPADSFGLRVVPDSIRANGTDTTAATGGPVKLSTGVTVPDGTKITVQSSAGTITTADADTLIPGIQVLTAGGNISFKIRAADRATTTSVLAQSVQGNSWGTCKLGFYDIGAPNAPTLAEATPLTLSTVRVTWRPSSSSDVIGYKVFYDTDSLAPFGGQSPYDQPSPIDAGNETTRVVGLPTTVPDTTWYVCVAAYDVVGRLSAYSSVLPVGRTAAVSGLMRYYSNQTPVDNVKLMLTGFVVDSTLTDSLGYYAVGLPLYHDYTATPSKTNAMRSYAVGALDASLVLQHVVHMDTLDSLQFRAADVTGDSAISSLDASRILEYAVGMRNHFAVGYRPGSDTVDWAFRPPTRFYDSISASQPDQNYTAILYGDPSGNWHGGGTDLAWADFPSGAGCRFFSDNLPTGEDGAALTDRQSRPRRAQAKQSGTSDALDADVATDGGIGVTVPSMYTVKTASARNAVAADMLIRYDAGQVTLTRVATTTTTKGFLLAASDHSGLVRISLAGTRELNGAVDMVRLEFRPGVGRTDQAVRALPVEVVWLVLNEGASPRTRPTGDGATAEETPLPKTFYLLPPAPNPLSGVTAIRYGLPRPSNVTLSVFDASGRRVRTLQDGALPAGRFSVVWDGKDNVGRQLANGVYFVRMRAGNVRLRHKVVLLHE